MSKLVDVFRICCCFLLLNIRLGAPSPLEKLVDYVDNQTSEVLLGIDDYSGKYSLEMNMSITLNSDKNVYITRSTKGNKMDGIEYNIRFPSKHPSLKLKSITFNGKIHYIGPIEEQPSTITNFEIAAEEVTERSHLPEPAPTTSVIKNNEDDVTKYPQCSKNTSDEDSITNSLDYITNGEFPWLVAIFLKQTNGSLKFICGGNLISSQHVLTATHCVRGTLVYAANYTNLLVILGHQNINNWSQNSEVRGARYYTHPEFRGPDAQIALLVLDKPVTFSATIRPICLWDEPEELESIVGKKGIIVGWSKGDKYYLDEAKQIQVNVVSQVTCLRSSFEYVDLTSRRTFCAGTTAKGEGFCTGDSGSGFVMNRNGIWKLRGIVSTTLRNSSTNRCETGKNYAVFSDVAKYTAWLRALMI